MREKANEDLRFDAAERRITELYLKAVEHLGSEKAPVRLAGLYALDRLAQDNPPQRQTIVNVISAYLRMPYQLPADNGEQLQEREVRITAQRIITGHLNPDNEDGSRFWEHIRLDLSGALLIDFSLQSCELGDSRFDRFDRGTHFLRDTKFTKSSFAGTALFGQAVFARDADFDRSTFLEDVWLGRVVQWRRVQQLHRLPRRHPRRCPVRAVGTQPPRPGPAGLSGHAVDRVVSRRP
ncbi:pentapeptide repeat-containing protein [Amycolatopsis acidicola]|uniref:pentapeptide repeat-containing protein n=1 Tax=Amycolatopsis acidicola TaxID=2596893 RepID=UPI001FB6F88B|nr:pentapeptide repeat-containing protein [Amycolatopsis acidicola]